MLWSYVTRLAKALYKRNAIPSLRFFRHCYLKINCFDTNKVVITKASSSSKSRKEEKGDAWDIIITSIAKKLERLKGIVCTIRHANLLHVPNYFTKIVMLKRKTIMMTRDMMTPLSQLNMESFLKSSTMCHMKKTYLRIKEIKGP